MTRAIYIFVAVAISAASYQASAQPAPLRPNIVFILADDLGYGDLGSYGQQVIQTPNLDSMADEGMRFTQFYAGSTVCAPSRASLLTGLHTGRAPVRGNVLQFLDREDTTFGHLLQAAGYNTIGLGKWGMGDPGTEGIPSVQGFDFWYGYLNHLHAHNYYTSFLFLDDTLLPVPGNVRFIRPPRTYTHDLFTRIGLNYLEGEPAEPFFLFMSYTIPHANTLGSALGADGMPVPDDAPYSDEPWPQTQRNHAAMITRMDRDIGRLLDVLKATGLADNTLVMFTSDNGPHREGGADPEFFDSNGPLRGIKRDLFEGGVRVPFLAWWPGMIEPQSVSDNLFAFWDLLPTFTELAGAETPGGIDGISFVPELLGPDIAGREQDQHEFVYWEFNGRGFQQAVRKNDWKAVTMPRQGTTALFDLAADPGETTDVSSDFPTIVAELEAIMDAEHEEFDGGLFGKSADGQQPRGIRPLVKWWRQHR